MTEYYEMWENVSARIQGALAAIKTVKLAGAEGRETGRLQATANAAYDDYLVRTRLANRYLFLQNALNQLSKALVLGYGGWMVLERRLTPGDVVMFVAYLDRLFDPIESLSSMAVTLQQNLASLAAAVRLLETGTGGKARRRVGFRSRQGRVPRCAFPLRSRARDSVRTQLLDRGRRNRRAHRTLRRRQDHRCGFALETLGAGIGRDPHRRAASRGARSG